jgi:hypothetical protein
LAEATNENGVVSHQVAVRNPGGAHAQVQPGSARADGNGVAAAGKRLHRLLEAHNFLPHA